MEKLIKGKIPKGSECPWKNKCKIAIGGSCHHQGKNHPCDFSCATARGFQMMEGKYKGFE